MSDTETGSNLVDWISGLGRMSLWRVGKNISEYEINMIYLKEPRDKMSHNHHNKGAIIIISLHSIL